MEFEERTELCLFELIRMLHQLGISSIGDLTMRDIHDMTRRIYVRHYEKSTKGKEIQDC